jgi:hypothetical protein
MISHPSLDDFILSDADNELKFSVNTEGRYVTEQVPRQVGIRAGAIVQGFVRSGHDSTEVEPLVSDDRNVEGLVTLGQLAKKHKINLNADTLVMEKKARYCTHLCKLDTKDYGIPQTRNRKVYIVYKFGLRPQTNSLTQPFRRFSSTFSFGAATTLTTIWAITFKKS